MNPAPRYFVRVGPEIRGPYDVAQLRQLAEVGVIAPMSEVAVGREGPWVVLDRMAQRDEVFPARTSLRFKAAEFTAENPAVPDASAPLDVQDLIEHTRVDGPI